MTPFANVGGGLTGAPCGHERSRSPLPGSASQEPDKQVTAMTHDTLWTAVVDAE